MPKLSNNDVTYRTLTILDSETIVLQFDIIFMKNIRFWFSSLEYVHHQHVDQPDAIKR